MTSTDLVVEIGAGSGRLTAPLADRAREVRAIELDRTLADLLRRRFARTRHVIVLEGDVLQMPLPVEPFRVVANLPFSCTSAVLRRLLDDPSDRLTRADVIVEWGVALKRTACWPSTSSNVTRGALYEFAITRRLPARCFEPAPDVDAALLTIRRRGLPLVPLSEHDDFRALVSRGFSTGVRRAAVPVMTRRRFGRVARELGFPPSAVARELDLYQWVELYRAIRTMR